MPAHACMSYSEKPRGILWISSDKDDQMGEKIKTKKKKIPGPKINPPKKSHAEFPKLKNFQEAKQVWLYLIGRDMREHYHKSSDCFEYPKNTSQIVPPKKFRSSLSLEIQSTPLGTNEKAQSCLSTCCSFLFFFFFFHRRMMTLHIASVKHFSFLKKILTTTLS